MTEALARLLRSPQGALGSALLLALAVPVVAGPWLAPYDPEQFHFTARLLGPGPDFWLGTDQFGRDLLSRLLVGARSTVLMAVAATALGTGLGAVIGNVSAFAGGRLDEIVMRLLDAVMAIPGLLFALLIVTALGASELNALIAIGITFTPGMARIARSVALTVRKQDYVSAAIARGETQGYIVLREMLPNCVAPIIVEATIRVAFAVMLLATLSFLGLGAQPPSSEWGLMVAEARQFIFRNPWMIVWPGIAIAVVAVGFNLLGDGLRDALNPRT
ncbi:peptide/nickel transport system permease protein [Tistlia consotensis]|uniref:Peptide/nickel transport system permease protein n=1 Tax=Tistlia consotensis USBA 355 TaxID=560819 RepID=A0A1Y6B8G9_9PROT|nr:ABC transporter permease [Tistlia consotensis]SME98327.1 peptide/nickel transport system permease protein [Tistlia consotensis USBA 355]SNR57644.1 peptide/nickel transport system permease protein [Tistlia consotensis]